MSAEAQMTTTQNQVRAAAKESRSLIDRVSSAIAVVSIIVLSGAALTVIVSLPYFLLSGEVSSNVKVSVVALLGVTIAAILTHYFTNRREIAARHFARKQEVFERMLDTIIDHARSGLDPEKLNDAVFQHKKKAAIWADHDLLLWWSRLAQIDAKEMSNKEMLLLYDGLIRTIRKELGMDDSNINEGDLISLFLPRGRNAFDAMP